GIGVFPGLEEIPRRGVRGRTRRGRLADHAHGLGGEEVGIDGKPIVVDDRSLVGNRRAGRLDVAEEIGPAGFRLVGCLARAEPAEHLPGELDLGEHQRQDRGLAAGFVAGFPGHRSNRPSIGLWRFAITPLLRLLRVVFVFIEVDHLGSWAVKDSRWTFSYPAGAIFILYAM